MGIDARFYIDNAERRLPVSSRSASPRDALGGAQRAGALPQHRAHRLARRCLAVLAGPSARELGQDCLTSMGQAPHLAALERVVRRVNAA